jgi:hypothetical protein
MPLQNRVTPAGVLVAVPERGRWLGNRGRLHDGDRRVVRHHQGRRWISCRLEWPLPLQGAPGTGADDGAFKGRHRTVMSPGSYTELFFADEPTAFAAGHRPCVECRRAAWLRLASVLGVTKVDELDAPLQAERLAPGGDRKRRHTLPARELPDGTMLELDGRPWLLTGDQLRLWTPGGYRDRRPRPSGTVTVLTPPTLVSALRGGYELDGAD